MEEAKASYICEYDPNIPITIAEAKPFLVMTDTEVPTMTQIEDYQTLLIHNKRLTKFIEILFDEKIEFIELIKNKDKEIEELKSMSNMKALMEYEELLYLIFPTENKALITTNVSGLGNDDAVKLREKRMFKQDYTDQKNLRLKIFKRQSYWNICNINDKIEKEESQKQQVMSQLHSPMSVRVN